MTISLYGSLARAFERKYQTSALNIRIQVSSVSELMRAMEANFKGFRQMIKKKGLYHICRGEELEESKTVAGSEIEMNFGEKIFHVMPVAAGCDGKNGVVQTIAGVVLIVAGAVLNAYGYGAVGVPMMKMGAAMAFAGAAQMLTSTPLADPGAAESADNKKSYLFSGPTNSMEPGTTIMLPYGRTWAGSIVASGGLVVEDI